MNSWDAYEGTQARPIHGVNPAKAGAHPEGLRPIIARPAPSVLIA